MQTHQPVADEKKAEVVKLIKEEYVPTKPVRMGSGGQSVFTFAAVAAGTAEIKIIYRRPWEKDKEPADSFAVTMTVE